VSRIALATCRRWPALSDSDAELAAALRIRGHTVVAVPWNGPVAPFLDADLVVIRATWDYHEDLAGYREWLARVASGRTVVNDAALVSWNLDKRYLADLRDRGIAVLPWEAIRAPFDDVAARMRGRGWARAVLKPMIGASGVGVRLVESGAAARLADLDAPPGARFMLQEYAPEIARAGELAGVFLGGRFSHGLRRAPRPGEFRVNAQYGGVMEACALPARLVAEMADVLTALPGRPVYARVDGMERDGRLIVMEVEVNEPGLGLHLAPGSAARFAEALERAVADSPHRHRPAPR
jgi:glutathione synthase/RimK-type ligase-like ATP-grasp enzyme